MNTRDAYPSDLTNEQWALIEPFLTAWKQERVARSATGDPGSCDLREIVNALLYQNRTGCQWRLFGRGMKSSGSSASSERPLTMLLAIRIGVSSKRVSI